MNVVILSKLTEGTGNKYTAERISSYLDKDFKVFLLDSSSFQTTDEFNSFIKTHDVKAILGVNLVRAGKLLTDCCVPVAMIFGGTDLNIAISNGPKFEVMTKIVYKSQYLISFNNEMKAIALTLWPKLCSQKILVQPQGVVVSFTKYDFKDLFKEFSTTLPKSNVGEMKIFLMVGGIRPVKDILFLADILQEWHSTNDKVYLVVIGPELDRTYARKCREIFSRSSCLYIFDTLPQEKVNSLMKHSFGLVNSSLSEGMAGAVLEAMKLGLPVIARKNDGNASLITDNMNGLLYDTPQEFLQKASLLLCDDELRKRLTHNGLIYINEKCSCEKEKETYLKVMKQMTSYS